MLAKEIDAKRIRELTVQIILKEQIKIK